MAETYTLQLLVNDSAVRRLEERINRIMGFKPEKEKTESPLQRLSNLLKENTLGKMLGKVPTLAGILAGVVAAVALLKNISGHLIKSSPMLEAMVKLFNTSILFIFRPIGDFIGHFLRPIMIHFLFVSVYWYKTVGPVLLDGVKNIQDNLGFLLGGPEKWAQYIVTAFQNITEDWNPFADLEWPSIPDAFGDTGEEGSITSWFDDLGEQINEIISGWEFPSLEDITSWFEDLTGFELPAWEDVTSWFADLGEKISNYPIISNLATWFSELGSKFASFAITDLPGMISGWFYYVTNKFSNFALNDLPGMISGWFYYVTNKFRSFSITDLGNLITGWFDKIKDRIGRINITSSIISILNAIRDAIIDGLNPFSGNAQSRTQTSSYNWFNSIPMEVAPSGSQIRNVLEPSGRSWTRN